MYPVMHVPPSIARSANHSAAGRIMPKIAGRFEKNGGSQIGEDFVRGSDESAESRMTRA
jgi:hypothetical protein